VNAPACSASRVAAGDGAASRSEAISAASAAPSSFMALAPG
jgi:hypothetical protein